MTDALKEQIKEKVNQIQQIDLEIKELEKALQTKQQIKQNIEEIELIDLMDQMGVKTFQLNPQTLIKTETKPSLPTAAEIERARGDEQLDLAERKYDGLEWLRENGGEDIIKNNIQIQFGSQQDSECTAFAKELDTRGIFYKRFTDIHQGSLVRFLKDYESKGNIIPEHPFHSNNTLKKVNVLFVS